MSDDPYDWETDEKFDNIIAKEIAMETDLSPLTAITAVLVALITGILLVVSPALVIWVWQTLL